MELARIFRRSSRLQTNRDRLGVQAQFIETDSFLEYFKEI